MSWTRPLLALCAVATVTCSASPGSDAEPGDALAPDGKADDLADGKALYDELCGTCHGLDGEGYVGDLANALGNQDFLKIASDEFLFAAIEYGRPGTAMPTWGARRGGPLSDEHIAKIVAYIRAWQNEESVDVSEPVAAGDAVLGEDVYRGNGCSTCHGKNGQGRFGLSLNNPYFLATIGDGFLDYSIRHGRRDTTMRAYADRLTDEEIANVVAFIRSWEVDVDLDPVEVLPPSYDELVIHPDGPEPEFDLTDGRYVSADDLYAAYAAGARMVIVDARPLADWAAGHIPGAAPFPFYDIDTLATELPMDGTWIIAYCGCPHHLSGQVVDWLRGLGFPKTAVLDEGVFFWADRGYPIEAAD